MKDDARWVFKADDRVDAKVWLTTHLLAARRGRVVRMGSHSAVYLVEFDEVIGPSSTLDETERRRWVLEVLMKPISLLERIAEAAE